MTTLRTADAWKTLVATSVERGKTEILADMARGIVPADCDDFSLLHNTVDANEYGGLCEDGWIQYTVGDEGVAGEWTPESEQAATDVQNALHAWLQSRRRECFPDGTLLDVVSRARSVMEEDDHAEENHDLIVELRTAQARLQLLLTFVRHAAASGDEAAASLLATVKESR